MHVCHTLMFQVIKQIKILIKDKTSKHNMQFLNEVVIMKGKQNPNPHGPGTTTVTVCLPLPLSPHPYMVLPVSQSLLVQSVSALCLD